MDFWDHHRASFLRKNPKSSLVRSQMGLRKWKLYVRIECQLGYIMMLISNGIWQYVWKYAVLNKNICHFWDHHRPSFPENIQRTETYTNDATLRSGFFCRKTRSMMVPRFGFFKDSRISVKGVPTILTQTGTPLKWQV